MSGIKHNKVVSTLPATLEADSVYYVRVGIGFDIYVTNSLGVVVAFPINRVDHGTDSVGEHGDVALSGTNSAKQVLKNDGSGTFTNDTLDLDDLDDVVTTQVSVGTGWVMKYNGTVGVWAMREVVRNRAIVINTATNLDDGVVISRDFNFQRTGLYSFDIKFNYSGDATGSDAQAALSIIDNGVESFLSLINGGLILKEEMKDATGNDGDGRGTTQKKLGAGRYYYEVANIGTKTLRFRISSEADRVETASWEASIVVEEEFGVIEQ